MQKHSLTVVTAVLGLALALLPMATVRAAELQILAGGGIAAPLKEIAAQFESASGHKTVIRFGTTPELIKMATTGGPFDLGVVPQDVMKDAAARAQFAAELAPNVARVGLAVAVRAGAPKPDIGTPDALKQTLLKAQSVASIPASATGTQLAAVYERLAIAEAMKTKTKAQPAPTQIIRGRRQRRRRARHLPRERADRSTPGCGWPLSRRSPTGSRLCVGDRSKQQRNRSRQGVSHLPDVPGGRCRDQGKRHDPRLRQTPADPGLVAASTR